MSISKYIHFLHSVGIQRTDASDGEIVLSKLNALKAISMLKCSGFAVLGGDVYERESDGYFRPTYNNWHCERIASESKNAYTVESHRLAYE